MKKSEHAANPDQPEAGSGAIRLRALRAELDIEATYQISGHPPAPARICEISRTGLQIRVFKELVIGSRIAIEFDPGVAADPRRPRVTRLIAHGQVVRLALKASSASVYGIDLKVNTDVAGALRWLALLTYVGTTP